MGKRKYRLYFTGSGVIEIDDAVFDAVDDQWRKDLYDLETPEEIAEMVGRCMLVQCWRLSSLDGWADQPDSNARVIQDVAWKTDNIEEIK